MQDKIIAAIAAYLEDNIMHNTGMGRADSWVEFQKKYQSFPVAVQSISTEIAAAIAPLVEAGEPDWKDAPEWANYIATDWDGQRHWFESEPYKHNSGCWFNENGTKYQKINTPNGDDWDISLQQRPKC